MVSKKLKDRRWQSLGHTDRPSWDVTATFANAANLVSYFSKVKNQSLITRRIHIPHEFIRCAYILGEPLKSKKVH